MVVQQVMEEMTVRGFGSSEAGVADVFIVVDGSCLADTWVSHLLAL